jgi:hypothetical protein
VIVVDDRYLQLWNGLHALRETWLDMRITVREDRPHGEATLLVDRLCDEADDGLGAIEDGLTAVARALAAPDDVRAGGRALAVAHEQLARVERDFWECIGSFERRRELQSLARRHGGEWAAWAQSVDDGVGRIPRVLALADEELRHAWAELVEHAVPTSIAMSTSEVGQQITVIRSPERPTTNAKGR